MGAEIEKPSRDDLILENMERARATVRRYVKANPRFQDHYDDLLGAAYLKLVEVVDRFVAQKTGKDKKSRKIRHLRSYVRRSVMREIVDHFREDSLIPVRTKTPIKIESGRPSVFVAPPDIDNYQQVANRLFESAKDEKDIAILQAKIDISAHQSGPVTAAQVAKRVNLAKSTVYRRLREIKKRYDEQTESSKFGTTE